MEGKSSVLSRWKLFSLGCFFGSLLLILFIDQIQQKTSSLTLTAPKNNMARLPPYLTPLAPPTTMTTTTSSSNLTIINPIDKPSNVTFNSTEKAETQKAECDMFHGRWVYNSEEKPSYDAMTCPFIEMGLSCQKNGRPDFEYENWRWEARDCDIPLFDGKDMLERLGNKRVIIVGDSINKNMWESLACLLYTSIPSSRAEIVQNSAYKALIAKDYNFVLEFHWSPFLTELDQQHKSGRRVLILDKISPNSEQWKGADVMIFNSGHWWTHKKEIQKWDLFEYKGNLSVELPREVAYKRGMRTWLSWLKKNVDPNKTTVFFRSISPTHTARKYDQWCYNETRPKKYDSYELGSAKSLVGVIERLIKGIKTLQVKYLNITKLSEYRIDAHPSIYTTKLNGLTKKLEDNRSDFLDCSHWCLPGLPDTWNRLLYASIYFQTLGDMPTL